MGEHSRRLIQREDEAFPRDIEFWTCPTTGLVVPKRPVANVQWRSDLLAKASKDEGFQKDLYTACALSPLFWINAFVWTYRQKKADPIRGEVPVTGNDANVPFITWEIQDDAIKTIHTCMDVQGKGTAQDFLINKSRDMGASWIILTMFHHPWLFVDNVNLLWVSATAADVDMHPTNNPDTLFWKHDYINHWLPQWMRPPIHRRNMHIGNKLRGNSLDGEATTGNVGRGGRRTAIGFDEFAAVEDGEGMLEASSDTTSCRGFNSTPKGPGTAFTNMYKQVLAGTKEVKLITLPWWEHPEKGYGRRLITQNDGTKKFTSDWYEAECRRRSSVREIAQNLDMDHMDSGSRYFDGPVVARHRSSYEQEPVATGRLDFVKRQNLDDATAAIMQKDLRKIRWSPTHKRRPWGLWVRLIDRRPDQAYNYIIGADISNGQGASNSVLSVRCKETGEKVAEFACADTAPHDLARLAAIAGMWFGSKKGGYAMIVPEANGPGGIFIKELVKIGYPNVYLERRQGTVDNATGKRYGWHSSKETKGLLLGTYRRELSRDTFINPSKLALAELEEYIVYDSGTIGPAKLLKESEGARAAHGDRVIADALTCIGDEVMSGSEPTEPAEPSNSYAARRRKRKARARSRDRWAPRNRRR